MYYTVCSLYGIGFIIVGEWLGRLGYCYVGASVVGAVLLLQLYISQAYEVGEESVDEGEVT